MFPWQEFQPVSDQQKPAENASRPLDAQLAGKLLFSLGTKINYFQWCTFIQKMSVGYMKGVFPAWRTAESGRLPQVIKLITCGSLSAFYRNWPCRFSPKQAPFPYKKQNSHYGKTLSHLSFLSLIQRKKKQKYAPYCYKKCCAKRNWSNAYIVTSETWRILLEWI